MTSGDIHTTAPVWTFVSFPLRLSTEKFFTASFGAELLNG
jgi:hypothetical protein